MGDRHFFPLHFQLAVNSEDLFVNHSAIWCSAHARHVCNIHSRSFRLSLFFFLLHSLRLFVYLLPFQFQYLPTLNASKIGRGKAHKQLALGIPDTKCFFLALATLLYNIYNILCVANSKSRRKSITIEWHRRRKCWNGQESLHRIRIGVWHECVCARFVSPSEQQIH